MKLVKCYAIGLHLLYFKIVGLFPSRIMRNFLYLPFMGSGVFFNIFFGGVILRSPWKIKLGRGSVVGEKVQLDCRRGLVIGNHVNISSEVQIWTLHHDPQSSTFKAIGKEVVIEDYVWLGARSIILPGVRVGKGAVVGAGSVVARDVEPYSIVVGNPAKKVKSRNENLTYKLECNIPFI
ncbi:acyltransferase [Neptunomonas phycophila]|uniref:acyltransferase n=1 Tax=Neptunomonas phycophila TaxID=1572645 RepID=UPI000948FF3C|nr:acyltransferase [Neptunomonas phycophila]